MKITIVLEYNPPKHFDPKDLPLRTKNSITYLTRRYIIPEYHNMDLKAVIVEGENV